MHPLLHLLAVREVSYKSRKKPLVANSRLADGKLQGKSGTILSLARDHPADADDAPFTGAQIPLKVTVMFLGEIGRHEHLDVLPKNFLGRIVKQLFGYLVVGPHPPLLVNDNDRVE